jgi:hypothetical protein
MIVVHTSTRLGEMLCAAVANTIDATIDENETGLK